MGGKHKQAQRTKDNAKPSSSGRSAALLANVTTPVSSFASVKDHGFVPFFSSLPATKTEEFDATIDSNFQLVLKKMNKKDSTTRLKALQEFAALVENAELDAVKAVLPFWPRLYCLLAGDIEHRVREAAQEAHRIMVLRVKRNMAPYLRQVAGPWFTAQYDTYPPVGTAATRAFQDAFPANKFLEAIMFCREEILKFISDNLLGPASQSSNSAKNVSADKLKARQLRITVSCLQGFASLLRLVPSDQLPDVQNLVGSKRFWELAADEAAPIRSAWMCVLTAVLERAPQLISDRSIQVLQTVLARLDDPEPSVLPYVWEAGLHVLSTIQDWETHNNLDKMVLSPLWRVLKEAGHGNAASIFPNLLPVLSCLLKTRKTIADRDTLCDRFFSNLREGFVKKTVIQSRAESEAVAQCYIECVRYISSTDNCSPQQLVENYLIPPIEAIFTNAELTLLSKAIFEHIASLVQYWSRNKRNPAYVSMLQFFWDSLSELYTKLVKSSDTDSLSPQIGLCLGLNSSRKNRKKVHFDNPSDDEKKSLGLLSAETIDEDFKKELVKFVHLICALYMTELKETKQSCFVVPLSKLVTVFNSLELFNRLFPDHNLNDMLVFVQQSWPSYTDINKQAAMKLVFCWISHLAAEERLPTLWSLSKKESMMVWMVQAARIHYSEPHVREWLHSSKLREYLLGLAQQISADSSSKHAKTLLKECVSTTADGGLLVGEVTTSAILRELCLALAHNTSFGDFVAELGMSACGSLCCGQIKDSLQQLALALFGMCCHPSGESSSRLLQLAWQEVLIVLVGLDEEAVVVSLISQFSNIIKKHLSSQELLLAKDIHHLVKVATEAVTTAASDNSSASALTAVFLKGLQPELGLWEQQLMALCLDSEKMVGATGIEPIIVPTSKHHDYSDIKVVQYMNFSLFSLQLMTQTVFKLKDNIEEETGIVSLFNQTKLKNPEGKIVKATQETNEDAEKSGDAESVEELDTSNTTEESSSSMENAELSQAGDQPESMSPEVVTEIFEDNTTSSVDINSTLSKETVEHLEDELLHSACSVAVCKVFRKHYQSTVHYSRIFPHIGTLQNDYENMMTSLRSVGLTSRLEQIANERARDYGGLWIWVRYLLSAPDQRCAAYLGLKGIGRPDYGAQVLAFLSEDPLSPSLLEDRPQLSILATWLHHLKGSPADLLGGLIIIRSLEAWPELNNEQLLRECDVSSKEPLEVEKISEMIRALVACISQCPQALTARMWDFILVSTPYYVLNLVNNQSQLFPDALLATCLQPVHNTAVFVTAICDLYCALAQHVRRAAQEQDAAFVEQAKEWNDVFSGDVHQAFLTLFVRIAGFMKTNNPSFIGHRLLQSLCGALIELEADHMSAKSEMVKKPVTVQEVVGASCELIYSSVQPLQITAYCLLRKALMELVNADAIFVAGMEVEDAEEMVVKASDLQVIPLLEQMQEAQAVVDIMLADLRFGDTCLVQPHTDSHHYTTAYLLLWDLLLEACGIAGSELRYYYTSILRDNGWLQSLLHHLFFLMPEEVLEASSLHVMAHLFQSPPSSGPGDACTSHELQHWACWVYHSALRRLPALVRQWWGDTKHKVNTVVQRVTYHYVSPLLCHNELHAIQTNNTKLKNMEVKVMPRAREVVASYAVDETRMELVITLPDVYPLGMVQVNSNAPLVGTNQWRNWVRHLSIFLTHQNGSVWDGLLLWKSNLDKRFEGVEECYICFSILHGSNFQIPKLCCKTCKKKFHSPCLYKWFSTSNKSTCPICRNMF